MKEIEEIPLSPIRMSYYYDSELSPEPVKDIIDFFNQYATMGALILSRRYLKGVLLKSLLLIHLR